MKDCIIGFAFLLNAFISNSQNLIVGSILNKNEDPIPGVNIIVNHTNIATITDNNGDFKLFLGNNPKALLIIRFIGYTPLDYELDLDSNYTYRMDIVLQKQKRRRDNKENAVSLTKVRK